MSLGVHAQRGYIFSYITTWREQLWNDIRQSGGNNFEYKQFLHGNSI